MELAVQTIHVMVWGPWTMALFLTAGVWFTIRSGVFQLRGLPLWWRETAGSLWREGRHGGAQEEAGERVTAFQSACTALAATIGTGNIVGVATALTAGGPGALFWMWVSALIGMMTAYGETVLGQKYRYRRADGRWMCGPMVYMERGLSCRPLGIFYAGLAVLSSLGMGSMVQSNSISGALQSGAGISPWISALAVTALTALVILGGIGRIAKVAERLMPAAAGIYIMFSMIVILSFWDSIPAVLGGVLADAWSPAAAGGGVSGFLMSRSVRYGMSRGVFSNEAGLGSMAVLHGAAEDTTAEKQGMWAMFEVFFDTMVICTLTALVILCVCREMGLPAGMDGAALAAWCFSARLGCLGELLVSGAMAVFAFATIIAWYYMGCQTAGYLQDAWQRGGTNRRKEAGNKSGTKRGNGAGNRNRSGSGGRLYMTVYLAAVFLGCVCRLELVWLLSDLWNGLMAYPNILALWLLSRQVTFPVI
ncbi:MAG: amino acid carrier protein [Eubacteriales bacterium]|nr:amino acid carrier protein [Eubacteriales bacterium]